MTPRCQFAPFSSLHDSPGWAVSHLMWRQSFESCTPPHKLLAIPSHTFGVYLYIFILVSSYLYIVMSVLRIPLLTSSHIFCRNSSSSLFRERGGARLWVRLSWHYNIQDILFQIVGPNSHCNIQNILFQIFHIVVFDSCAVGSLFDIKTLLTQDTRHRTKDALHFEHHQEILDPLGLPGTNVDPPGTLIKSSWLDPYGPVGVQQKSFEHSLFQSVSDSFEIQKWKQRNTPQVSGDARRCTLHCVESTMHCIV